MSPSNSEKHYIEIVGIISDLLVIYRISREKVAERFTKFHDFPFDFAVQHDESEMIFKAINIKNPNYYK